MTTELARLLTVTAVLAIGPVVVFALPVGVAAVLALFGLLRLCWLEDNIKNDLVDADTVPHSYLAPLAHRQKLAWHLMGLIPKSELSDTTPCLIATAMRGQVQAWSTILLMSLAVVVMRDLALPVGVAILSGGAVMALAMRRADALINTLAHLDRGQPLPRSVLMPDRDWAYSTRAPRDDD